MSHTVGETTTDYVWDVAAGLPVVLQDSDGNTYVYGLDSISATDGSGDQTYFLYDGLGSTTDLTDEDGDVVDGYTYDVFGAIRSQSGSSENSWLFTGEQFDSETGFTFLRARYLDPRLGRFLSMDSVQPNAPGTQGYNPYAYTANNPTTWVDPSGHFPFIALGLIIIPVGAILVCALTPWCNGAWRRARDIIDEYGNDTREGVQEWPIDRLRQAKDHFPDIPGVRRAGECVGDLAECARDLAEEARDRTYPVRAPLTIALEHAFRRLSDGDYQVDPQDEDITIITNCRGICELVPAAAFTIGHTIFTTDPVLGDDLRHHEENHVDQYEWLGDLFWSQYGDESTRVASLVACLAVIPFGGDYVRCLHDANILEILAGR